MVLGEVYRNIVDHLRPPSVEAKEIYQPPLRPETPVRSQPFFVGPIRGKGGRWGVETGGKIVAEFQGDLTAIEAQKEAFLKEKCLI